ncbi:unnamed protein product [Brassica rapa subsp. trilocularis]
MDICIKIIKNNKDFFDQSLDEIKLLKYVNKHDPADKFNLLRLYDYFYYRVLFQNDSPASLLARVIGIIRTIDHEMLTKGRDSHKHPWVSYPYEPIST